VQLVDPFGCGSVIVQGGVSGRFSGFGGSWLSGSTVHCFGIVEWLQGFA